MKEKDKGIENSRSLFERAGKVMPGGVNSPVRAFRSVQGTPRFISHAKGANIWDEDGNAYIDFIGSWGPAILGHAPDIVIGAVQRILPNGLSFGAPTSLEVEMAETVCRMVPAVEMVRMVNSGTEAVMSALRLARGYTGRDGIIKFEGCYHGHADSMLVAAGSGALTQGVPDSAGVPGDFAKHTYNMPYNDLDSVERLLKEKGREIAAVIVEPVAANMGLVLPEPGFLQGLRDLTHKHGALLIFDEVITGFRLSPAGAQGYFGITADLACFGKIIGGGMPVGAYGGRKEIMEQVSPLGKVYQAGTLSGNPIAMAAGFAVLQYLEQNADIYSVLEQKTKTFAEGMQSAAKKHGIAVQVPYTVGLSGIFFSEQPVHSYSDVKKVEASQYAAFFHGMLDRGVYFAPSAYEAIFISMAHDTDILTRAILACEEVFTAM